MELERFAPAMEKAMSVFFFLFLPINVTLSTFFVQKVPRHLRGGAKKGNWASVATEANWSCSTGGLRRRAGLVPPEDMALSV